MIIRGVWDSQPELQMAEDVFRIVLSLLDFTKLTKKANEHLSRILVSYSSEIFAP